MATPGPVAQRRGQVVAGAGAEVDHRVRAPPPRPPRAGRLVSGSNQPPSRNAGAGRHHGRVVPAGGALAGQVHVALAGDVERVPGGATPRALAALQVPLADGARQQAVHGRCFSAAAGWPSAAGGCRAGSARSGPARAATRPGGCAADGSGPSFSQRPRMARGGHQAGRERRRSVNVTSVAPGATSASPVTVTSTSPRPVGLTLRSSVMRRALGASSSPPAVSASTTPADEQQRRQDGAGLELGVTPVSVGPGASRSRAASCPCGPRCGRRRRCS